jgi:hypothetical protein
MADGDVNTMKNIATDNNVFVKRLPLVDRERRVTIDFDDGDFNNDCERIFDRCVRFRD